MDQSLKKLFQQSDKAELLEWVQANIGAAEKCLFVIGTPDGKGGMLLDVRQVGFEYAYEIDGFAQWVSGLFGDSAAYEED